MVILVRNLRLGPDAFTVVVDGNGLTKMMLMHVIFC